MKIGDKVKHSEYYTRPKRNYWLSLGREPDKTNAKENYENLKAERGIIVEVKYNKVLVKWDNNTISDCLCYMVELA